jgi:hypothetical protein
MTTTSEEAKLIAEGLALDSITNILNEISSATNSHDKGWTDSLYQNIKDQIDILDTPVKRPESSEAHFIRNEYEKLYRTRNMKLLQDQLKKVLDYFPVCQDLMYHMEQHDLKWRESVGLE